MHISLYDVDSTIPNLALMRLSAFHKKKGDKVTWVQDEVGEKTYASKIFPDSECQAYPNMVLGGSGVSLTLTLPEEVDAQDPDYSIYPDCDYSLGFITRGCIRKCPFCIVPEKEGKIHTVSSMDKIWRGTKNVVLLDNNILAAGDEFTRVLEFAATHKIKVDFNQGLDCRLVTPSVAGVINKYSRYIQPQIRFAFDSLDYKDSVERTCQLIKRNCFWYVYCDKDWESALERLLVLKRHGQRAYLMRDKSIRGRDFPMYNFLAHWANFGGAMRLTNVWEYHKIYYKK